MIPISQLIHPSKSYQNRSNFHKILSTFCCAKNGVKRGKTRKWCDQAETSKDFSKFRVFNRNSRDYNAFIFKILYNLKVITLFRFLLKKKLLKTVCVERDLIKFSFIIKYFLKNNLIINYC